MCLQRAKDDCEQKFIIHENEDLLREAKEIKKELIKQIEEPWKI
jgi:hypothetical protein